MRVGVDDLNLKFANVMRTLTALGIVVLLISSAMYFLDIDPFVEPDRVVETWHLPASEFWKTNIGHEIHYSEFLNPIHPDNMAIISLFFLAFAPFLSILSVITKFKGIYRLIAIIVIIELLFAAVRPIILGTFGE
jgi:hypothetical protein